MFLKVSGAPQLDVEGLANEAFAVCLAADLGLPTLEPFFVSLTPEWIDAIPDEHIRAMLENSAPVGFGSTAAGQQWQIWAKDDVLGLERRRTALEIFAFDVYCENVDRRPDNPNCLVKGDEFRIIDHELCFRIRQLLMPRPEPWRPGYVDRIMGNDQHIFGQKLKGKELDFGSIRASWVGITDGHLQTYLSQMPPAWAAAREAIGDAIEHVRRVRDRIDECLAEMQRALT